MIGESSFWKEELSRGALDLERRTRQRRWSERSAARLEKTLFLGFYAIRKLLEAKKLSDSIRDSSLVAICYPANGKPVTLMNWHRADKLYDFAKATPQQLTLATLCNLFVHSYAFFPSVDQHRGLDGVLINSERTRNKALYLLSIEHIIELFKTVAADDPDRSEMRFNERTGDYEVSLSEGPRRS